MKTKKERTTTTLSIQPDRVIISLYRSQPAWDMVSELHIILNEKEIGGHTSSNDP